MSSARYELFNKIEELILKANSAGIIKGSNPRLFTFYGQGLALNSHFAIGNFIYGALTKGFIEVNGSLETVRSYLYMTDLVVQLFSLLIKEETYYYCNSYYLVIGVNFIDK